MSAGWFDPTLATWFDPTEQEDGWFADDLVDVAAPGGGTITFVQSAHGEAGSGVSPTATFSSNVTSGNLLVIVAGAYRAGTPPHAFSLGDLTKSSGTATLGTAQLDIQHARSTGSNEGRVAIWSIPVTGTGSLTLSLAVNAGDYANIAAGEFSGADTSSGRLDTSLGNDGPGTGTGCVIGDMTSAGAGVFVGGLTAYTSQTTSWTPDGAFSTLWNEGNVAYNATAAIYRIVSSATTDSVDASNSPGYDSPGWAGASAVYKAASGGGGDLSLNVDTAGAITIAGQSVTMGISVPAGTGAVTLAGQSATFSLGITPTTGAVTLAGQSVAFGLGVAADNGAITLAGQSATLAIGANIDFTVDTAGAISLAGQSVTFGIGVATAAGAITLAGQSVTLAVSADLTLTPDAGQITIAGQPVTFDLTGVTTEEAATGGWANLARIERQQAARRKRLRDLEEEADRLEMALAAEGLAQPSPEVVARFTVRDYAPQAATFSRRTQRAIAYAERAQTALAYELALRQVQREIEDEETAIAMLLALVV